MRQYIVIWSGVIKGTEAMITMHKVGMEPNTIFKIIRTPDTSQMFLYRAIDRYNDASSVFDGKRSGRPRSVGTKKAIKAIR